MGRMGNRRAMSGRPQRRFSRGETTPPTESQMPIPIRRFAALWISIYCSTTRVRVAHVSHHDRGPRPSEGTAKRFGLDFLFAFLARGRCALQYARPDLTSTACSGQRLSHGCTLETNDGSPSASPRRMLRSRRLRMTNSHCPRRLSRWRFCLALPLRDTVMMRVFRRSPVVIASPQVACISLCD
jgi:hypothetical protein